METGDTSSRHDSQRSWTDPARLCGAHLCFCPSSAKNYWEAVGPAAEVWSVLNSQICAVGEASAPKDATFSVHMVMIGESRQDSSPQILFCAKDRRLHDVVRNAVLLKGIMAKYPTVGMMFDSNPPEHLAQDGQIDSTADANGVWAADTDQKVGRRLYVCGPAGGPPRIATGGPIFFDKTKAYQTTVRHVFSKSEKPPPSESQPCFQSDLDLELDSSDDESLVECVGLSVPTSDRAKRHPRRLDHVTDGENLSHYSEPGQMPDLGHPRPMPSPETPSMFVDPATDLGQPDDEGRSADLPPGSIRVGTAMAETLGGAQRCLDYVLVEVQVSHEEDANLVCFDPRNQGKKVRVTRPGRMDEISSDTPVVVITSSGPANGRLLTTPAYIKPTGWSRCQVVYPVKMDDDQALEPGDCGSAVIETRDGRVFGHVVFGHPHTKIAYILPMEEIINDIARVLGPRANLSLQQEVYIKRGNARTEPHVTTEFASPKFYKEVNHRTMPRKHLFRSLVSTVQNKINDARAQQKSRSKKQKSSGRTFESLFFSLPPEIRDQVIQCLDFRSAMSLRRVSHIWCDEVSVNGFAISEHFLMSYPLPPLAQKLYPQQPLDVSHIQRVWRCHAVASRLADYIATWLRKEMFLHGSRIQVVDFQETKLQIKRRLVPSLFLLVHFFQRYRQSLLDPSLQYDQNGRLDHHGIERNIMEFYHSPLILQTQDVALIFLTFLRRIMRPPSKYGSVERAIHRYLKEPPSDQELAGVLCFGGLDVVVRILDNGSYDRTVAAVHTFLETPPPPQVRLRQSMSIAGPFRPKLIEGDGESAVSQVSHPQPENLRSLLPYLPRLDDIWRQTGEELLMGRGAIRRPRDLNNFQQAMKELIRRGETPADRLYEEGHGLWHALLDREVRQNNNHPGV